VTGWSAAPCTFRFPNEKISGRAPGRSRNGFVGRHPAVILDPDDLASVVVEALRLSSIAAVPQGHVEQPGAVEDQARAEMLAGARLGLKAEDHLDVGELPAAEPATQDFGARSPLTGPGIGQVDPPSFGIPGVEGDVEEPPWP
jgi:hypothetical protein